MAIVVGIDGSPASDAALGWALEEARRRGSSVYVLHAFELPAPAFGAVPVGAAGPVIAELPAEEQERLRHSAEQAARALVEDALRRADAAGSGVEVQASVVEGEPSRALVGAARGAELLVVGSHGHGAVHDLLLGSVSHGCARKATCPVVILPPAAVSEGG